MGKKPTIRTSSPRSSSMSSSREHRTVLTLILVHRGGTASPSHTLSSSSSEYQAASFVRTLLGITVFHKGGVPARFIGGRAAAATCSTILECNSERARVSPKSDAFFVCFVPWADNDPLPQKDLSGEIDASAILLLLLSFRAPAQQDAVLVNSLSFGSVEGNDGRCRTGAKKCQSVQPVFDFVRCAYPFLKCTYDRSVEKFLRLQLADVTSTLFAGIQLLLVFRAFRLPPRIFQTTLELHFQLRFTVSL